MEYPKSHLYFLGKHMSRVCIDNTSDKWDIPCYTIRQQIIENTVKPTYIMYAWHIRGTRISCILCGCILYGIMWKCCRPYKCTVYCGLGYCDIVGKGVHVLMYFWNYMITGISNIYSWPPYTSHKELILRKIIELIVGNFLHNKWFTV